MSVSFGSLDRSRKGQGDSLTEEKTTKNTLSTSTSSNESSNNSRLQDSSSDDNKDADEVETPCFICPVVGLPDSMIKIHAITVDHNQNCDTLPIRDPLLPDEDVCVPVLRTDFKSCRDVGGDAGRAISVVDLTSDSDKSIPSSSQEEPLATTAAIQAAQGSTCGASQSSVNPGDFLEVQLSTEEMTNKLTAVPPVVEVDNDSGNETQEVVKIDSHGKRISKEDSPPNSNQCSKANALKQEDDSNASDEEYVVEKILSKKYKRGKPYYLLKWENYSEEHNTWEGLENLNCPELLAKFEKEWCKTHKEQHGKVKKVGKRGRKSKSGASASKKNKLTHAEDEEDDHVNHRCKEMAAAILRTIRSKRESSQNPVEDDGHEEKRPEENDATSE